jgi:hypothetical protein
MRTIALEEDFATPAYLDGPARRLKEQAAQVGGRFAALVDQLEMGDGRVAAMDAAGETMQAFSLKGPASNSSMSGSEGLFPTRKCCARGRHPPSSDAVLRPGGAANRRSVGCNRGARACGRRAGVQRGRH